MSLLSLDTSDDASTDPDLVLASDSAGMAGHAGSQAPSPGFPWLVEIARALAHRHLEDQPDRLRRCGFVATAAEELSAALRREPADSLIAAAWLHDIGYSTDLTVTGFQPLDGAHYLQQQHWPKRVVSLVAHHSGARFLAEVRGLSQPLSHIDFWDDEFDDLLTYADQTVGPDGARLTVAARIKNTLRRHGPESPSAQCAPHRIPYLQAVAERVGGQLAVQQRRRSPLRRRLVEQSSLRHD